MTAEEVLEEFVEAQQLGQRFLIDPEDRRRGDGLSLAALWASTPHDLAQEFLDADEVKRAEMRKIPTPKMTYKDPVKPGQRCYTPLTFADAQAIRAAVPRLMSQHEAARHYNVCRPTIQRILGVLGKQTHVKPEPNRCLLCNTATFNTSFCSKKCASAGNGFKTKETQ